jgi:signal transduction histidine kinase
MPRKTVEPSPPLPRTKPAAPRRQNRIIVIRGTAHNTRSSLRARLRRDFKDLFTTLVSVQKQHDLLRELDRAILESTHSADEVLAKIIDEGRKYTDAVHGQVVLVQRHRLIVKISSEPGRVGHELPLDHSLCGTALSEGHDLYCPDVSRLSAEEYVRFHPETASELVLLIRPDRGPRVFGMLAFERVKEGPLDAAAIEFAELLAGQAAIAIAQARIWKSVDLLHRTSTGLLTGELSLEDAYREILHSALEVLNFEHGQVLRVDGKEVVVIASSRGEDVGIRLLSHESVCGRYLLAEGGRTALRIDDITVGDYAQYYRALLKASSDKPMRSEMIVPLVKDGHPIGAINLESPRVAAFTEFDEKVLGILADLMIRSLSATLYRRVAVHRDRIEAANLAMTQLGHVAQNFLHKFGSIIGDVSGNLDYLRTRLAAGSLVEAEPGVSVSDFLKGLVNTLQEGGDVLDHFSRRFNPDDVRFSLKRMNLAETAQRAVLKFLQKKSSAIAIDLDVQVRDELGDDSRDGDGRTDCFLSEIVDEVVDNLVNNAVDAIQERQQRDDFKGMIRVVVSLPDPLLAQLVIIDNGIGVPPENRRRIFDFNFSTKKGQRPVGGIGLWFCELYMLQRGGTIAVRENQADGHGTMFVLQFPTVLASTGT